MIPSNLFLEFDITFGLTKGCSHSKYRALPDHNLASTNDNISINTATGKLKTSRDRTINGNQRPLSDVTASSLVSPFSPRTHTQHSVTCLLSSLTSHLGPFPDSHMPRVMGNHFAECLSGWVFPSLL